MAAGYDLKKAQSHHAARSAVWRTGYRDRWQWLRAMCPRWDCGWR